MISTKCDSIALSASMCRSGLGLYKRFSVTYRSTPPFDAIVGELKGEWCPEIVISTFGGIFFCSFDSLTHQIHQIQNQLASSNFVVL